MNKDPKAVSMNCKHSLEFKISFRTVKYAISQKAYSCTLYCSVYFIVAGLVELHFRECVSLTCCRHAHRRIPDSSLDHNKTASSLGHSDNAESALPRRSYKVQSDRCPHSCVAHTSDHAHTGYHTRGGLQYDYISPTVIPYSLYHTVIHIHHTV